MTSLSPAHVFGCCPRFASPISESGMYGFTYKRLLHNIVHSIISTSLTFSTTIPNSLPATPPPLPSPICIGIEDNHKLMTLSRSTNLMQVTAYTVSYHNAQTDCHKKAVCKPHTHILAHARARTHTNTHSVMITTKPHQTYTHSA